MPTRLVGHKTPSFRAYRMAMRPSCDATRPFPMLALEIDAIALRALETMPDVVAAVKLDRSLKPQ